MPNNESIPLFRPGRDVTGQPSAAVTGKRFVKISDDRDANSGLFTIAPSAAGSRPFGVAAYDAAIGEPVPVIREGIVPVQAGATITFDQALEVGADGKAVPSSTGVVVGKAISGATSGQDVFIALNI